MTPGLKSSGIIGSHYLSQKRTSIHGNGIETNKISKIFLKDRYKSTSATYFWTIVKGGLTNFSHIFNTKYLGVGSKTVECSFTGILILLEIYKLKK